MPRVFLSHSSTDKALVRQVHDNLRIVSEMDEFTFEAGLPTWDVITRAFERCDIFALFLSEQSFLSDWVRNEIGEARRRLRRNEIKRILIFCIDGFDFRNAPVELRDFAFFLGLTKPATITRAIQRHLSEIHSLTRPNDHAFVGRDEELMQLKNQIIDPQINTIAISVSGLSLMGRRDIIYHTMLQLKPRLHKITSVIEFEIYMSCTDIALELRKCVEDFISPDQISELRRKFASDDATACGRNLHELLIEVHTDGDYIIFSDRGGIINNAGGYTNIIEGLLAACRNDTEPTVFIITQRKPTARTRHAHPEVAFLDIDPLKPEQAQKYIITKARAFGITLNQSDIDEIIKLAYGHPQNIDFMIEKIRVNPPASAALRDIDDILEIGRDRAASILNSITLSKDASLALAVAFIYPDMPAEFTECIFEDFDRGLKALTELQDNHLIIQSHGIYSISPPMRDAVGKAVTRLGLKPEMVKTIAQRFVAAIASYQDDNAVPINIIDAASIAAVQVGVEKIDGNFVSYYILPSHYIYLAKMCYDQQQYTRAAEYAESATASRHALTSAAYIQACRWLGLSKARIGDEAGVTRAVRLLTGINDTYAVASGQFIQGFAYRLTWRLSDAKRQFEMARPSLGKNFSLLRELALVEVLLGEYDDAISNAESALETDPYNPYVLDIIVRAKLKMASTAARLLDDPIWNDVIARLKKSGSTDGLSFYQLRMAEFYSLRRQWSDALKYANEALKETPELTEVWVVRARIRLESGDLKGARDDRAEARRRQDARQDGRRRADIDLIMLEITLAVRAKHWRDAIYYWENLAKMQWLDFEIRKFQQLIKEGIARDRRDLSSDIRQF